MPPIRPGKRAVLRSRPCSSLIARHGGRHWVGQQARRVVGKLMNLQVTRGAWAASVYAGDFDNLLGVAISSFHPPLLLPEHAIIALPPPEAHHPPVQGGCSALAQGGVRGWIGGARVG